MSSKVKRTKNISKLYKAILDVEKGNVKMFDSLEKMMKYLDASCINYYFIIYKFIAWEKEN